uniref:VWFA domain-containing protein n=1 Tax=Monopterus albus TaxID=43700 RepID=A0A3Q3IWD3_MONAL
MSHVQRVFSIPVTLSFTIDVTNPSIYNGSQNDFFGYKVLQFISGTNKGIIVTAPLKLNGSGEVCKLNQSQALQCGNLKDDSLSNKNISVKHLGLAIAANSTGTQFIVCSPNVPHECNENSYLNSVCYKITDNLQQVSSVKPAFQECTKKTVDLVFLFDGSESMKETEFNKNKEFIQDIMKSLKNTSIKFAAVQFSTNHRKVFDFSDYQAGRALNKLQSEKHMRGLTNTHKALKYVLEKIFEDPNTGTSSDATKVVVIITDGNPSDSNKGNIIEKYQAKNIIRFVIGVNVANLDKFTDIASKPTDKYAFKIENYDGLTGILENFQKKIFSIEGSKVARAGDMTTEMSQSGFSAVVYKDTLILGSVGSNRWRGSLQELHGDKESQIEDPDMEVDSYMGYSVSVGHKTNTALYFTGAPRLNHTGQVILFRHNGTKWTPVQRINGEQIGSYFGAELCSVDIDSNGNTDFLIVGAPQFYHAQEKREGRMYIYTLTDEMQLKSELNVTAPSMSRFGTTISSLADLNGDGLRDVAVGAPLEDDNRGAVYIYLGDRRRGVRSTFSQRLMGQKIEPGMRFFGQAIDGNIDLGEDGLPDIVIGSKGAAVVLRSRPVFNVTADLFFQPKEISTEKLDCVDNSDENLLMVDLTACFDMVEATRSKGESSGLNISCMLDVDPVRQTYRGFFSQHDRKARSNTTIYELKNNHTCFLYSIYMPKCVKDTLSPITIKLNFSQADSEKASAVLNVDSKRQAVVEVPFEKHCRQNDTCIAELEVDFSFMTPTLLVAEDNYFNVSVKLVNHGDDSYNTSLTMDYPPGLSFSMMTLTKATKPTLHNCGDLHGVLNKTICGVSLPVYRSGSTATFKTSFYIMNDYEWDDTISMTITGKSDNTNSTRTNSLTKSIPVQFEIKMAITVKDTITYLNFTTEDTAPKEVKIIYNIANPGFKAFPVSVSLSFPTKMEHNFEINQVFIQQYCSGENDCKVITCDTFILDKESSTVVVLSGKVQFKDHKEHAANIAFLKRYTGDSTEVKFKSFIHVSYNKTRYMLDSHKQVEVRVEFIIPADELLIILTGAGIGLLLLIIITVIMIKLGCFKRKKLAYYQEVEDEPALQADVFASALTKEVVDQSETDGKSDQPAEKNKLLDDGEKNSSTSPDDAEEELDLS